MDLTVGPSRGFGNAWRPSSREGVGTAPRDRTMTRGIAQIPQVGRPPADHGQAAARFSRP
jgi:hypothetical protein